ncbi:M56 family metallopeptidase [Flavivirga jejuensis]|uniref:M56 family metallopeptidase n=1 Tax=Flavivirga jejuensis TaxID=870487 RepID=A0ABT8WJ40_9FLAO|nr:M56 family metallopeptidase [Flavivirga jejuensis]MDO5973120.1 M56 family metallopeptidase [Flavivirga jejuensis]
MLLILLKSSVCLAVFILFYKLCLEQTSAHIFKRYYLISTILISIGIPFITFTNYIEIQPIRVDTPVLLNYTNILNYEIEDTKASYDYLIFVLWFIYSLGVILFSFRFFKNLYLLIKKIKHNPKYKHKNFVNVLLQDLVIPHTFFNYIFINKTNFEQNAIPAEILLHEQTHAKQKHTLDVLFIEIIQIAFWFNPLLYLIKKDIKLNHEFLADQTVLKSGLDASNYQNILLAFSSNAKQYNLANAINYSLIKKRFTVMKTQTSKTVLSLRIFIILPLLAILIYSFSEKVTVEKLQTIEEISLQDKQSTEGATKSMIKEYNDYITEYESTKRVYHDKLKRAAAIYDLMTDAQRGTVKKYPEKFLSTHNPSKIKLKHPTQSELDSWKNSTELTITLDASRIKNTELSNYSPSDIVFFRLTFDGFPKNKNEKFTPNSCRLYTNEGFKHIILKHNFNDYHRLIIKYVNEIEGFLNSSHSNNSELRILKTQLDNLYANFSDKEIKEFNPPKALPLPTKDKANTPKDKKVSKKLEEYNTLAKKFNNPNPKGQRYSRPEIDLLYSLYKQLNTDEKANSEIFPNLPYPIQKSYKERMLKNKIKPDTSLKKQTIR